MLDGAARPEDLLTIPGRGRDLGLLLAATELVSEGVAGAADVASTFPTCSSSVDIAPTTERASATAPDAPAPSGGMRRPRLRGRWY